MRREADKRVRETWKYPRSGPRKMDVEREQAAGTSQSILSTKFLRVFIRTNTVMKFRLLAIPSSLFSPFEKCLSFSALYADNRCSSYVAKYICRNIVLLSIYDDLLSSLFVARYHSFAEIFSFHPLAAPFQWATLLVISLRGKKILFHASLKRSRR